MEDSTQETQAEDHAPGNIHSVAIQLHRTSFIHCYNL